MEAWLVLQCIAAKSVKLQTRRLQDILHALENAPTSPSLKTPMHCLNIFSFLLLHHCPWSRCKICPSFLHLPRQVCDSAELARLWHPQASPALIPWFALSLSDTHNLFSFVVFSEQFVDESALHYPLLHQTMPSSTCLLREICREIVPFPAVVQWHRHGAESSIPSRCPHCTSAHCGFAACWSHWILLLLTLPAVRSPRLPLVLRIGAATVEDDGEWQGWRRKKYDNPMLFSPHSVIYMSVRNVILIPPPLPHKFWGIGTCTVPGRKLPWVVEVLRLLRWICLAASIGVLENVGIRWL